MTPKQAIEKAIAIMGGPSEVARAMDKPQGSVSGWIIVTGKCPADLTLDIEARTFVKGEPITRWELRPDIFGSESTEQDTNAAEFFQRRKKAA